MGWSYNPLWKLMIDRGMKHKKTLQELAHIGPNTMAAMSRNAPVSMKTLDDICNLFHCRIEDILEHVEDDGEEPDA